MTAVLVTLAVVLALPLLLLIGFALGPVALVLLFIVACAAPILLLGGAILHHARKG